MTHEHTGIAAQRGRRAVACMLATLLLSSAGCETRRGDREPGGDAGAAVLADATHAAEDGGSAATDGGERTERFDAGVSLEHDAATTAAEDAGALASVDAGGVESSDAGPPPPPDASTSLSLDAGAEDIPPLAPPESGVVEARGEVGGSLAIRVDAHGRVFVAYTDESNDWVMLARSRPGGFDSLVVDDMHPGVGYVSLALDSAGRPHLAYRSGSGVTTLRYVHMSSAGEWTREEVLTGFDIGADVSLALDAHDVPHIAHRDRDPTVAYHYLMYSTFDGTRWRTEVVDRRAPGTVDLGMSACIQVDQSNRPRIAYIDAVSRVPRYARWTGREWLVQPLTAATFASTVSLTLDSMDVARAAYVGGVTATFASEITAGASVGLFDSVAIGEASGNSRIAIDFAPVGTRLTVVHADLFGRRLIARQPFAGSAEVLVSTASADHSYDGPVATAHDAAGNLHIAFQDSRNANVEYAFVPASTL